MKIPYLFIVVLMLAGCTRNVNSPQSQLVLGESFLEKVQSLSFPTDKKICYGANVFAADLPNKSLNSCSPPTSITGGFVNQGQPLVLNIPRGAKRTVSVYAFAGDDLAGSCPAWESKLDYEKIYKVAESEPIDLNSAVQSFSLVAVFPGLGNSIKSQLGLDSNCDSGNPAPTCDNDLGGADLVPSDGDVLAGSYCNINNFTVSNGVSVALAPLSEVSVSANNISIQGTIDGSGKGYGDGLGPGAGTVAGHGGSHAGPGGGGVSAGMFVSVADAPAEFGSGGFGGTGGFGGGKITLTSSGNFDVSSPGLINMNGLNPHTCAGLGGGGSGGTIVIHADSISGFGSIQAKGGSACSGSGGGSGGRVAVHYNSISGNPNIDVGQEFISGGGLSEYGSPGTFFKNDITANQRNLEFKGSYDSSALPSFSSLAALDEVRIGSGVNFIVNSSGVINLPLTINGGKLELSSSTSISVPITMFNGEINLDGSAHLDSLLVSGGTVLLKSTTLSFGDLDIQGGMLTHQQNDTSQLYWANIVANNLTIGLGGKIDLNKKGYMSEKGPGGQIGVNIGGTHAGAGGSNSSSTYGDSLNPMTIGSGGYGSTGYANATYRGQGAGGGHARITVSGNFVLDGVIEADGGSTGCCINFSGGAGGSIYVSANNFSGTGSISAKGGSKTGSGGGAGGGGGIIALYYTSSSFSGASSSDGGAGSPVGIVGSVHDAGVASYPGP